MTDTTTSRPRALPAFMLGFRDHPASVGETYFGHMAFALRFSGMLLAAGGAAFVHAIIPPLFETTASRILCRLHAEISSRHTGDH